MISLTKEQTDIIDQVLNNIQHTRKQTIGGYAGTGKSTLITELVTAFDNPAVCAYTGKAANVLRQKGLDATTIHSLIYNPVGLNENVYFEKKPRSQITNDIIIVDEASMVNESIYEDLLSYNIPIIFVGDHGQLEPIGPNKYNLMKDPDYKLEKILRNDNEIAIFAEWLRFNKKSSDYVPKSDQVIVIDKYDLHHYIDEADQIICGYNNTRVKLNNIVRAGRQLNGRLDYNEKIMCLRNYHQYALYNGMQATVIDLYNELYVGGDHYIGKYEIEDKIDKMVIDLGNGYTQHIDYEFAQFGQAKPLPYDKRMAGLFDYAYCITCHKAQGDEWDKVLVIEESSEVWKHDRWCYTAASRAKNKLIWAK